MYVSTYHINIERDNGVKAIENLMEKKGKFDYILLETRYCRIYNDRPFFHLTAYKRISRSRTNSFHVLAR